MLFVYICLRKGKVQTKTKQQSTHDLGTDLLENTNPDNFGKLMVKNPECIQYGLSHVAEDKKKKEWNKNY